MPQALSNNNSKYIIGMASSLKYDFYIIATPIGNCKDITLRALETLQAVDGIICEDTRITRKILQYHNISNKLSQYNDLSTPSDRIHIINRLKNGEKLALVSDAGTPLIADPGYKLIQEIYAAQLSIDVLPGACAAISGLVLSGMPSDSFYFAGFLPNTTIKRQNKLSLFKSLDTTLILYESPHRLINCLSDIHTVFGDIDVAVVREISKIYQETVKDNIIEVINNFNARQAVKGEFIIVFRASAKSSQDDLNIDEKITALYDKLKHKYTNKDAVNMIINELKLPRKIVYQIVLNLIK